MKALLNQLHFGAANSLLCYLGIGGLDIREPILWMDELQCHRTPETIRIHSREPSQIDQRRLCDQKQCHLSSECIEGVDELPAPKLEAFRLIFGKIHF